MHCNTLGIQGRKPARASQQKMLNDHFLLHIGAQIYSVCSVTAMILSLVKVCNSLSRVYNFLNAIHAYLFNVIMATAPCFSSS